MAIRSLTTIGLVLAGIIFLAFASEKRAVYDTIPRQQNSTSDGVTATAGVEEGNDNESQCPDGQLFQRDRDNNTFCCRPTACKPGFFIKTCTKNGGDDTCLECPDKWLQPNHISSANMTESKCFPYIAKNHDVCPSDTKNHTGPYSNNCPYWCVCNTDSCFFGDPCYCSNIPQCGINEQFDPVANKCMPCPWYAFKNSRGCQKCEINVTLWRMPKNRTLDEPVILAQQTTIAAPLVTKTTAVPEVIIEGNPTPSRSTETQHRTDHPNNILPIVIALVVVSSLLIILISLVWRRTLVSISVRQTVSNLWAKILKRNNRASDTTVTRESDRDSLIDPDHTARKETMEEEEEREQFEVVSENLGAAEDLSNIQTIYDRTQSTDRDDRKENMQMVGRSNPGVARQNSIQVDADVHSSSNSSINSDPEVLNQETGEVHQHHLQGSSMDPFREAVDRKRIKSRNGYSQGSRTGNVRRPPTASVAVPVQGKSLVNSSGNEDRSGDTGIGMDDSFLDQVLDRNLCRAENASVDRSFGRAPTERESQQAPMDTRVVIGESAPSSVAMPPLTLTMPSTVSTDKAASPTASVQSPPVQSPRIIFDDPKRESRPVGKVEPQPRENFVRYNSGGHSESSNLNRSNSSDSDVTSYVFPIYRLDNGHMDIAQISDVRSGQDSFSVDPMSRDSIDNSVERRNNGRNDPDGASIGRNSRSETHGRQDETSVKEVVPESDEYHQTSLKFVDREDTQCKSVRVNPIAIGMEKLKSKQPETATEQFDSRPDTDEILEIVENSSIVAGGNGVVCGKTNNVVMEGEDSNIDGLMNDGNLTGNRIGSNCGGVGSNTAEIATSTRGQDSSISARTDGVSCDSEDDDSFEIPQFAVPRNASLENDQDEESFELPNTVLDQRETTFREDSVK